tara:strand:- start:1232 stop:1651 length:420 start_codon:yes stop_codon:yes gene_type:complete
MSNIKQELLDSYTEANYHVYANPSFILKIGQSSKELRKLLADLNVKFAAFITAFNPYSKELELIENRSRNKILEGKIKSLALYYIKGDGRCGDSGQVGEESFLVFGLSKKQAINLGMESQQNAIVVCEINAKPSLLLLK